MPVFADCICVSVSVSVTVTVTGWSCIRTDYTEIPDSHTDTSKLQTGDNTLRVLLPPDTDISAQKLRSWQLKRIIVTAATWHFACPDWNEPVFLSGVYISPGQGLTPGDIAEDIQILAEIMTSVFPTSEPSMLPSCHQ
jgi:hypothetical protein